MNRWIVLVGNKYPALASIDNTDVAAFESEEAAWVWIKSTIHKSQQKAAFPVRLHYVEVGAAEPAQCQRCITIRSKQNNEVAS